ncbi:hypothetical protein NECID01_0681 [Nematocida sp. AWRm77]|nr:hypothetical protein NECID01_0681 [Nematocida sp. AWRm77]
MLSSSEESHIYDCIEPRSAPRCLESIDSLKESPCSNTRTHGSYYSQGAKEPFLPYNRDNSNAGSCIEMVSLASPSESEYMSPSELLFHRFTSIFERKLSIFLSLVAVDIILTIYNNIWVMETTPRASSKAYTIWDACISLVMILLGIILKFIYAFWIQEKNFLIIEEISLKANLTNGLAGFFWLIWAVSISSISLLAIWFLEPKHLMLNPTPVNIGGICLIVALQYSIWILFIYASSFLLVLESPFREISARKQRWKLVFQQSCFYNQKKILFGSLVLLLVTYCILFGSFVYLVEMSASLNPFTMHIEDNMDE